MPSFPIRRSSRSTLRLLVAGVVLASAVLLAAQNPPPLPATTGQTLAASSLVLAQAVRGHRAILVASFSRDSNQASSEWMRALHSDAAFSQSTCYQIVMLQKAPGFVRGIIHAAMRRQTPEPWQPYTVILTADESAWRAWFGVKDDSQPWIVALSANGRIVWRGHGGYADAAASLKAAIR
jgi:hypothetical protein